MQLFTDCAGCQTTIVPVIASFDSEGHIKPLYVRIGELSLKIQSSWMKPSPSSTLEFHCTVQDGDTVKPVILIYRRYETVWMISGSSSNLFCQTDS